MFCPKCGIKLEEGTRYCSNCGFDTNPEKKEILETTNINNEVLKNEKENSNEIINEQPSVQITPESNDIIISNQPNVQSTSESKNIMINNQPNVQNIPVTNDNKNEVNVETPLNNKVPNNNETNRPVYNNTINTNPNPNNDNKTAIIVMLSIIAFMILFLVAIYLAFFSEDSKLEKPTDKEPEIKEEIEQPKQDYNSDSIEATIETDEGTITFLVPKVCTNNRIQDFGDNYKSYTGNDLECLNISFTYLNYESAAEGQEMLYTNPNMTEYDMEKMVIELNNGIKAPALKITEHLGIVFYPVNNTSYIEIRATLNEITEQEIRKYIIIKE